MTNTGNSDHDGAHARVQRVLNWLSVLIVALPAGLLVGLSSSVNGQLPTSAGLATAGLILTGLIGFGASLLNILHRSL